MLSHWDSSQAFGAMQSRNVKDDVGDGTAQIRHCFNHLFAASRAFRGRYHHPMGWTVACIAMLIALVSPAIWNRFPIVFYDTGGYLVRPFEATLGMGRSALYGAFLTLGIEHNFWLNIAVQAALVVWLVVLTLRLHGFGRPWLATAIVLGLCAFTGLPWYTAQLMPDIFVPISVLALALLAFYRTALRKLEIIALLLVIAAAIASHMSILALAIGITVLLVVWQALPAWIHLPRPGLALPVFAVVTGVLLAPLSNLAVTGQFAFTPGGFNFVFSRMVQDGIVKRYLADHCPDTTIRLCAYQAELPLTADDWLWNGESAIYKLGGFEKFEPEARRIVIESLTLYPNTNLQTAFIATINQFVAIATGDGLTPWSWHTQWAFSQFAPSALKEYLVSRQAQMPFDFGWINFLHIPIQSLALAILPAIILLGHDRRIAAFAVFLLAVFIGNAAICGVLSNPHDRYQNRLVWLASFAVVIAGLEWHRSARRSINLTTTLGPLGSIGGPLLPEPRLAQVRNVVPKTPENRA
jgi:hypothetical protein